MRMELLIFSPGAEQDLAALLLAHHGSNRVTIALRRNETPGSQARRVCLILARGQQITTAVDDTWRLEPDQLYLVAVAVAQAKGAVTTTQVRFTFEPIVLVEPPLRSEQLLEAVPTIRHRERVRRALNGGKLPPKASAEAWAAVLKLSADLRLELLKLAGFVDSPPGLSETAEAILQQDRDATLTALEIFDPGERSHRTRLRASDHPDPEAPFLARVGGMHQLEDQVIGVDARNFLDWIGTETTHAAAMTFRSGPRSLTIVNANKAGLEKSTGADLIYFNSRASSFVFVQYKMFEKSTKEWLYYPDSQFSKELGRLQDIEMIAAGESEDSDNHYSYRLGPPVTYFKFCRRDAGFEYLDVNLMKGYYVPAEYVDALMSSMAGPKGAKRIVAAGLNHRSLNSATFSRLVATGYIGTRGSTSVELNRMVAESLETGHSVIAAIEHLDVDWEPPESAEAPSLPEIFGDLPS
jgi:hypothetical protein